MRVLSGLLAAAFLLIAVAISPLSVLRLDDARGRTHYYYIAPELLDRFSRRPEELRSWIPTGSCLILAALLGRRAFRRA